MTVATMAATGFFAATLPVPAASANSVANIPLNVIQTIANMPAAQIDGVNKTSAAFELGGNWWLYQPGNVLGYDQADIAKVNGITSLLMPIPAIAQAVANPINVTFEANFPMTPDCTGAPAPCANPTYWDKYFKVMPWQLIQGVSYGTVRNTIDPSITMPWSNTTQRINVFGLPQAVWETLTKTPEGFRQMPTPQQVSAAYSRLGTATFNALNPFVEGTYCLPCQFVVKGAPGSLARIPLFGNWYTIADFGQPFTSDDWVGRPAGIPKGADVDAKSLWSPEGQARVQEGADEAFQRVLRGDIIDTEQIKKTLDKLGKDFDKVIPKPADISGAANAVGGDFGALMASISSSFGLPTAVPPAPAPVAAAAPIAEGASSASAASPAAVAGATGVGTARTEKSASVNSDSPVGSGYPLSGNGSATNSGDATRSTASTSGSGTSDQSQAQVTPASTAPSRDDRSGSTRTSTSDSTSGATTGSAAAESAGTSVSATSSATSGSAGGSSASSSSTSSDSSAGSVSSTASDSSATGDSSTAGGTAK
ncbi:hypothetical protein TSST111916_03550 [Tsukamurella strandjordii]|nr:hypothetical protein TTY48_39280 [Tsukamurella sp. TY48]